MKKTILTLSVAVLAILASCSTDDSINQDTTPELAKNTFRLTLRNAINYVSVKKIGTAPLTTTGQQFTTTFKATQGTYLSFANMFAQSNDWFFAPSSRGIKLWEGTTPLTGDISDRIIMWRLEGADGIMYNTF